MLKLWEKFVNSRKNILLISSWIAIFVALVGWALAAPPVAANHDDDFHRASIWCGQGLREGLCEQGTTFESRLIPGQKADAEQCFVRNSNQSAACLPPESLELFETSRLNTAGYYPPVYYGFYSIFASNSIYGSVVAIRIANALLFCIFGFISTKLVADRFRLPMILAIGASIVPLGMNLIPSINPSSWAIISACFLWPLLATFLDKNKNSRLTQVSLAVCAVLLTFMGAGSRSDSAIYCVIGALVALGITWRRGMEFYSRAWLPILVISISIFLYSTGGQSNAAKSSIFHTELFLENLNRLPELWTGIFGRWPINHGFDTHLSPLVWFLNLALFMGLLIYALNATFKKRFVVLSLSVALLLAAVPLVVLNGYNVALTTPWDPNPSYEVSPRYIYPLIFIWLGVTLIDSKVSFSKLSLVVFGWAVIANAMALFASLRRYVSGEDIVSLDLNQSIEWWWAELAFSPQSIWLLSSLAFAIGLITLLLCSKSLNKPLNSINSFDADLVRK